MLIILAGVTISVLTGDNSIINRAIQAKDNTKVTGAVEQVRIATIRSC
ncbi:MAG: hypothetical protein IJV31_12615 [Clostridia bacterium]|nr:hypothetical protein [Clostridia bacterium]